MVRVGRLSSLLGVWLAGCGGGSAAPAPPAPATVAVERSGHVRFRAGRGRAWSRLLRHGRAARARRNRRAAAKRRRDREHDDRRRRAPTRSARRAEHRCRRCACAPRCCASVRRAGTFASSTTSTAMRSTRWPAPCSTPAPRTSRAICMRPRAGPGSAYTATRSAAPFAILDTVYDAVQLVLTATPSAVFPALRLHWSTAQRARRAARLAGEIGTSRYRLDIGIFLCRRREPRYRRVRPPRDRARVRSLPRAPLLALRQHRRPATRSPTSSTYAWRSARPGAARSRRWSRRERSTATRTARTVRPLNCSFSFNLEQSPSRLNPNPGWFNEESLQVAALRSVRQRPR